MSSEELCRQRAQALDLHSGPTPVFPPQIGKTVSVVGRCCRDQERLMCILVHNRGIFVAENQHQKVVHSAVKLLPGVEDCLLE